MKNNLILSSKRTYKLINNLFATIKNLNVDISPSDNLVKIKFKFSLIDILDQILKKPTVC